MSIWITVANIVVWICLAIAWLKLEGRIARNDHRLNEVEKTLDRAKKWGKFKSQLKG